MSTSQRLDNWARWSFVGRGLSLDYPSSEPFAQMQGGGIPIAPISDDEGCYIDGLLSALAVEHPLEAKAVAYYHLYAQSYRKLAKMLGCNREMAARYYESGYMWIKAKTT